MNTPPSSPPSRDSWDCYSCRQHRTEPAPTHAWLNPKTGLWAFVCADCRGRHVGPRPDMIFCPDCGEVEMVEDDVAEAVRHDPEAHIAIRAGALRYLQVCSECMAHRADGAIIRSASRRRLRSVAHEMRRVRDMAEHFRQEGVYTEAEAIERAVAHEMLVDDAARHPEFMRWLRGRS